MAIISFVHLFFFLYFLFIPCNKSPREAECSAAACSSDEPLQRRDRIFSKSIKAREHAVFCVASDSGQAPKWGARIEAWKGGRERDYVKGCNAVAEMQCMATACGAG